MFIDTFRKILNEISMELEILTIISDNSLGDRITIGTNNTRFIYF